MVPSFCSDLPCSESRVTTGQVLGFENHLPDALWLEKEGGFFSPEHIIKSSLVIFHLNQSQVFQLFIKNQVFEIVREALK